jgi:predicted DNA-binding protein
LITELLQTREFLAQNHEKTLETLQNESQKRLDLLHSQLGETKNQLKENIDKLREEKDDWEVVSSDLAKLKKTTESRCANQLQSMMKEAEELGRLLGAAREEIDSRESMIKCETLKRENWVLKGKVEEMEKEVRKLEELTSLGRRELKRSLTPKRDAPRGRLQYPFMYAVE